MTSPLPTVREGERAVLDLVVEKSPPFSPESVVKDSRPS